MDDPTEYDPTSPDAWAARVSAGCNLLDTLAGTHDWRVVALDTLYLHDGRHVIDALCEAGYPVCREAIRLHLAQSLGYIDLEPFGLDCAEAESADLLDAWRENLTATLAAWESLAA